LLILVLYSSRDEQWKIADFGLAAETDSKRAITTVYSRGTEGYRAPELLLDEPKFSEKVDVWAIGCILYELTMCKKAFPSDLQVRQFSTAQSTFHISNPNFPSNLVTHISDCICEIFERDPPNRPPISVLCLLFGSYCTLLDPLIAQDMDDITSIPEYHDWKKFVAGDSKVLSSLFSDLSDSETSKKDKIIQFLIAFINEFPNQQKLQERLVSLQNAPHTGHQDIEAPSSRTNDDFDIENCQTALQSQPLNYWLWHRLCNLYIKENDLDGAIEMCKLELSKNPTNPSPLMEISNLYVAKGDYTEAWLTSSKVMHIKPHLLQIALEDIAHPSYKPTSYEVKRKSSFGY
jgi:serine/threonine protein kinase